MLQLHHTWPSEVGAARPRALAHSISIPHACLNANSQHAHHEISRARGQYTPVERPVGVACSDRSLMAEARQKHVGRRISSVLTTGRRGTLSWVPYSIRCGRAGRPPCACTHAHPAHRAHGTRRQLHSPVEGPAHKHAHTSNVQSIACPAPDGRCAHTHTHTHYLLQKSGNGGRDVAVDAMLEFAHTVRKPEKYTRLNIDSAPVRAYQGTYGARRACVAACTVGGATVSTLSAASKPSAIHGAQPTTVQYNDLGQTHVMHHTVAHGLDGVVGWDDMELAPVQEHL